MANETPIETLRKKIEAAKERRNERAAERDKAVRAYDVEVSYLSGLLDALSVIEAPTPPGVGSR